MLGSLELGSPGVKKYLRLLESTSFDEVSRLSKDLPRIEPQLILSGKLKLSL
jgi:hypothetical protein